MIVIEECKASRIATVVRTRDSGLYEKLFTSIVEEKVIDLITREGCSRTKIARLNDHTKARTTLDVLRIVAHDRAPESTSQVHVALFVFWRGVVTSRCVDI